MKAISGLVAFCAAVALLFPAVVKAESYHPYLQLSGSYVWQEDNSAGIAEKIYMDDGYGIGGAVGLDFGVGRLEVEGYYRDCDVDKVKLLGTKYNGDGDISTFALMANAYYVLRNETIFQPYVMGGLGAAYIDLNNIDAGAIEFADVDDTQFAYQVGGGIELDVSPRFKINAEYRYFRLSNEQFEDGADNKFDYGYETHNAQVGVRFLF